jgi:hypothetical protein
MKLPAYIVALLSFTVLVPAQEEVKKAEVDAPRAARETPTAEEVLRLVRLSYTLQDHKLTGNLEDYTSGKTEPFSLNMSQQVIRFLFQNPSQIVNLDLSTLPARLTNTVPGGKSDVPLSSYGEKVRGFDLNYEDLSLRFLYWTDSKLMGEDRVGGQKTWKVRVTTPDGLGPYGTVDVWVHQGSGGMAKMEGWDKQGNLIKRFEITDVQKAGDSWVPKKMKIQTINPTSSYSSPKATGVTYMKFDKPVKGAQ